MEAALEADDLVAWARADERFHQLLMERCGNKRLTRMFHTIMDQSVWDAASLTEMDLSQSFGVHGSLASGRRSRPRRGAQAVRHRSSCPPASTGSDQNLRISEHSEGNAARGRAAVPQNHRHFVARLIVPTVRRPTWEVSHAEHSTP